MASPESPGRGSRLDPGNRFTLREVELDGDERDLDAATSEGPSEPTRVFSDTSRSVISRNTSPDIPFDVSLNPYRGCEHGCSYCLHGDTQVLLAGGDQRALGDLAVGDEIVGTRSSSGQREPVATRVLATWTTRRRAYALTLRSGSEVLASGEHRFFSQRGWRHVASRAEGAPRRGELASLALGDVLLGVGGAGDTRVARVSDTGAACDMVDITTGTGDFIANGVLSHNCYARPTHEYLGLSAGLDFERILFAKLEAPTLLERALASHSWVPQLLALSGVTDAYQPIERKLGLTRGCLEVLAAHRHPVGVITKNALVTRDADLLAELAHYRAARVAISITTLDDGLRRRLEPRTATASARLRALRALSDAGVPVGVHVAPVIPGLNDHEIPAILQAAAEAGATSASWTLLRLPGAVQGLFVDWLTAHAPLRAERVLGRLREAHDGSLSDSRFGHRMRGEGAYVRQIGDLFDLHRRRFGLDRAPRQLETGHFRVPGRGSQTPLFP